MSIICCVVYSSVQSFSRTFLMASICKSKIEIKSPMLDLGTKVLKSFGITILLNFQTFSQLAHDVVTTLGFSCILVATSDNVVTTLCFRRLLRLKTNVVTTLCFRRRFSDPVLTLHQRRDSDIVFLKKAKGIAMSL